MDINNFDPKNPPSDFNVDMGLDWYLNELVKQKLKTNEVNKKLTTICLLELIQCYNS
jgi:hypothetical protein